MSLAVTPKLAVQPFAGTPESLIRLANTIVANCGISMTAQRVTRLVRSYRSSGIHGRGYEFFDYFATQIQLTVETRRRLLADPSVMKAIAYCDPVGEQAVNNVMRQQKNHPLGKD